MSTFTPVHSEKQAAHHSINCASHRNDKEQGELRRETTWIAVPTPPNPGPKRDFNKIPILELRFEDGEWREYKEAEEYRRWLCRQRIQRSWYTTMTKRYDEPVPMKRTVKAPLEILTVNYAPWVCDWIIAMLEQGNDPVPHLCVLENDLASKATRYLAGQRHLIGRARHQDTRTLHYDLCFSRQDGLGGRIGDRGLMLVGPWLVAASRQVMAGHTAKGEKAARMFRDYANFKYRYPGPGKRPLDVELALHFDESAALLIGDELTPFREAYVQSIPALEHSYALNALAKLDAARDKILQQMYNAPESVAPAPSGG